MKIAKLLACVWLTACGPDSSGGLTGPPPDRHEEIVLENIPYDALGGTRVTFSRSNPQKRGVISLDGASRTAGITHSVWGTWVSESPTSGKLAYAGYTDPDNHDRALDIHIRDWAAATGTALGGPGRARDTPSWNAAGTRVVYAESISHFISVTMDRIISQSPTPGSADRQVLWQGTQPCEWAWSPKQSATNELVFLYSPGRPNTNVDDCATDVHLARATPGGLAQILYKGGPGLNSPTWSPSGAEIAFFEVLSFDPSGFENLALKRMAADGSNIRTIAMLKSFAGGGGLGFSMCWPGDGSRIVFNLWDVADASHIFVVAVADGAVTQITAAAGVNDAYVSCR